MTMTNHRLSLLATTSLYSTLSAGGSGSNVIIVLADEIPLGRRDSIAGLSA